ncbi:WXG100 family type VII secretion target [Actinokineospora inagensis]|uniref:WXG100 family type VII secretion target n=1 Tax=Actinokineospora inagensis TaxID=103730 RepID=UPI0004113803|nr:PPE domain-containing protein [Actinokineospora inagensis]
MVTGQQGGDRYVTGGVDWDKYSLADLVKMVDDQASAPQLEQLADDWRAAGSEVVDAAAVLSQALDELMNYWSGSAAEQARHDVALNAQWVSDLGETAHEIGTPIQEAAGALKAAQVAMAALPVVPATPPALAVDSADKGLASGGPVAAAVNGAATGSQSAFTAEQEQAKLKAQAVDVMKRFEGAAIGIDQATPRFAQRDPQLHEQPGDPTTTPPQTSVGTPVSYNTDIQLRWATLTAGTGDPTTAAQGFDDGHRAAAGSTAGGSAGGYSGGYGGGSSGASTPDASRGPLQSGGSVGATEALTGGTARTAVPSTPAAAAAGSGAGGGTGMGGMPMGGGMGAGQSGGGEHRRRYPFEGEDPFALDQKASPPVIGL